MPNWNDSASVIAWAAEHKRKKDAAAKAAERDEQKKRRVAIDTKQKAAAAKNHAAAIANKRPLGPQTKAEQAATPNKNASWRDLRTPDQKADDEANKKQNKKDARAKEAQAANAAKYRFTTGEPTTRVWDKPKPEDAYRPTFKQQSRDPNNRDQYWPTQKLVEAENARKQQQGIDKVIADNTSSRIAIERDWDKTNPASIYQKQMDNPPAPGRLPEQDVLDALPADRAARLKEKKRKAAEQAVVNFRASERRSQEAPYTDADAQSDAPGLPTAGPIAASQFLNTAQAVEAEQRKRAEVQEAARQNYRPVSSDFNQPENPTPYDPNVAADEAVVQAADARRAANPPGGDAYVQAEWKQNRLDNEERWAAYEANKPDYANLPAAEKVTTAALRAFEWIGNQKDAAVAGAMTALDETFLPVSNKYTSPMPGSAEYVAWETEQQRLRAIKTPEGQKAADEHLLTEPVPVANAPVTKEDLSWGQFIAPYYGALNQTLNPWYRKGNPYVKNHTAEYKQDSTTLAAEGKVIQNIDGTEYIVDKDSNEQLFHYYVSPIMATLYNKLEYNQGAAEYRAAYVQAEHESMTHLNKWVAGMPADMQDDLRPGQVNQIAGSKWQWRTAKDLFDKQNLPALRQEANNLYAQGHVDAADFLNKRIVELENMTDVGIVQEDGQAIATFVTQVALDPLTLIDLISAPVTFLAAGAKAMNIAASVNAADAARRLANASHDAAMLNQRGGFTAVQAARASNLSNILTLTPLSVASTDRDVVMGAVATINATTETTEDARIIMDALINNPQILAEGGLTGLTSPYHKTLEALGMTSTWGASLLANDDLLKRFALLKQSEEAIMKAPSLQPGAKWNPIAFMADVDRIVFNQAQRNAGIALTKEIPFGATDFKVVVKPGGNEVHFIDGKGKTLHAKPFNNMQEAENYAANLREEIKAGRGDVFAKLVRTPDYVTRAFMTDFWLNLSPGHWVRNATSAATAMTVDGIMDFTRTQNVDDYLTYKGLAGGLNPRVFEAINETGRSVGAAGEAFGDQPHITRSLKSAAKGKGALVEDIAAVAQEAARPLAWLSEHGSKIWSGNTQLAGIPIGEQNYYRRGYYAAFKQTFGPLWTDIVKNATIVPPNQTDGVTYTLAGFLKAQKVDDALAKRIVATVTQTGIAKGKKEILAAADAILQSPISAPSVIDSGIPTDLFSNNGVNRLNHAYQEWFTGPDPKSQASIDTFLRRVDDIIDYESKYVGDLANDAPPMPGTYIWQNQEILTEAAELSDDMIAAAKRAGIDPAVANREAHAAAAEYNAAETVALQSILETAQATDPEKGIALILAAWDKVHRAREATRKEIDALGKQAAQTGNWSAFYKERPVLNQQLAKAIAKIAQDTKSGTLTAGDNTSVSKTLMERILNYDNAAAKAAVAANADIGSTVKAQKQFQELLTNNRAIIDGSEAGMYRAAQQYPTTEAIDIMFSATQRAQLMGAQVSAHTSNMLTDALAGKLDWTTYFTKRNKAWGEYYLAVDANNRASTLTIIEHFRAKNATSADETLDIVADAREELDRLTPVINKRVSAQGDPYGRQPGGTTNRRVDSQAADGNPGLEADRGVQGATPSQWDTERGLHDIVTSRATGGNWPETFTTRIHEAIAGTTEAAREWMAANQDAWDIVRYATPEEAPDLIRPHLDNAGITYAEPGKPAQIIFGPNSSPDQDTFDHELVHAAWKHISGAEAQPIANDLATLAREQSLTRGHAILDKWYGTQTAGRRPGEKSRKPLYDAWGLIGTPLEYSDSLPGRGRQYLDDLVATIKTLPPTEQQAALEARLQYELGQNTTELTTAIQYDLWDDALPSNATHDQYDTISLFAAIANKLGIPESNDWGMAELVAYKAQTNKDFHNDLFGMANLAKKPGRIETPTRPDIITNPAHLPRSINRAPTPAMPNTPAFKAWFGNGVQTTPVFHGSPSGDIEAFDLTKAKTDGLYGPGIYTTTDPDVAAGHYKSNKIDTSNSPTFRTAAERDAYMQHNVAPGPDDRVVPLGRSQGHYKIGAANMEWSQGYAWRHRQEITTTPTQQEVNALMALATQSPEYKALSAEHQAILDNYLPKRITEAPLTADELSRVSDQIQSLNMDFRAVIDIVDNNQATNKLILPEGPGSTYMLWINNAKPFDINKTYTTQDINTLFPEFVATSLIEYSKKWHYNNQSPTTLTGEQIYSALRATVANDNKAVVNRILEEAGFDSIKHFGGGRTNGRPHQVNILFHETQLKSAIANTGEYSPTNPAINRRVRPPMPDEAMDELNITRKQNGDVTEYYDRSNRDTLYILQPDGTLIRETTTLKTGGPTVITTEDMGKVDGQYKAEVRIIADMDSGRPLPTAPSDKVTIAETPTIARAPQPEPATTPVNGNAIRKAAAEAGIPTIYTNKAGADTPTDKHLLNIAKQQGADTAGKRKVDHLSPSEQQALYDELKRRAAQSPKALAEPPTATKTTNLDTAASELEATLASNLDLQRSYAAAGTTDSKLDATIKKQQRQLESITKSATELRSAYLPPEGDPVVADLKAKLERAKIVKKNLEARSSARMDSTGKVPPAMTNNIARAQQQIDALTTQLNRLGNHIFTGQTPTPEVQQHFNALQEAAQTAHDQVRQYETELDFILKQLTPPPGADIEEWGATQPGLAGALEDWRDANNLYEELTRAMENFNWEGYEQIEVKSANALLGLEEGVNTQDALADIMRVNNQKPKSPEMGDTAISRQRALEQERQNLKAQARSSNATPGRTVDPETGEIIESSPTPPPPPPDATSGATWGDDEPLGPLPPPEPVFSPSHDSILKPPGMSQDEYDAIIADMDMAQRRLDDIDPTITDPNLAGADLDGSLATEMQSRIADGRRRLTGSAAAPTPRPHQAAGQPPRAATSPTDIRRLRAELDQRVAAYLDANPDARQYANGYANDIITALNGNHPALRAMLEEDEVLRQQLQHGAFPTQQTNTGQAPRRPTPASPAPATPRGPVTRNLTPSQQTAFANAPVATQAAVANALSLIPNNMTPAQKRAIMGYIGKMLEQFDNAVLGASRVADDRADFAMLNYKERYNLDNVLAMFIPYHYFWTRSAVNWAKRVATKPASANHYIDFQKAVDTENKQNDIPVRMKGTVPLYTQGDGTQIRIQDPTNYMFPFSSYTGNQFITTPEDAGNTEQIYLTIQKYTPGLLPYWQYAAQRILDATNPLPDGKKRADATYIGGLVPQLRLLETIYRQQTGEDTRFGDQLNDPYTPYVDRRSAALQGVGSDDPTLAMMAQQISLNLEHGQPRYTHIPAEYQAAADEAYKNAVKQTGNEKLLAQAARVLGIGAYAYTPEERLAKQIAGDFAGADKSNTNPYGSDAAQDAVMEQNPWLKSWYTKPGDPGADQGQPAIQAQKQQQYEYRQGLYDQSSAEIQKAIKDAIAANPRLTTAEMSQISQEIKDRYAPQINAADAAIDALEAQAQQDTFKYAGAGMPTPPTIDATLPNPQDPAVATGQTGVTVPTVNQRDPSTAAAPTYDPIKGMQPPIQIGDPRALGQTNPLGALPLGVNAPGVPPPATTGLTPIPDTPMPPDVEPPSLIEAAAAAGIARPNFDGMSAQEQETAYQEWVFKVSNKVGDKPDPSMKPAPLGPNATDEDYDAYNAAYDAYNATWDAFNAMQEQFITENLTSPSTLVGLNPMTPDEALAKWEDYRQRNMSPEEVQRREELEVIQGQRDELQSFYDNNDFTGAEAFINANPELAAQLRAEKKSSGGTLWTDKPAGAGGGRGADLSAVETIYGPEAAAAVQEYLDLPAGEARQQYLEEHPEVRGYNLWAFDPATAQSMEEQFGEGTVEAWANRPAWSDEDKGQQEAYAAYMAEHPEAYLANAWLNGRPEPFDPNAPQGKPVYDKGADFAEAQEMFGEDIWDVVEAYKRGDRSDDVKKRYYAFSDWWNAALPDDGRGTYAGGSGSGKGAAKVASGDWIEAASAPNDDPRSPAEGGTEYDPGAGRYPPNMAYLSSDGLVAYDQYGRRIDGVGNTGPTQHGYAGDGGSVGRGNGGGGSGGDYTGGSGFAEYAYLTYQVPDSPSIRKWRGDNPWYSGSWLNAGKGLSQR